MNGNAALKQGRVLQALEHYAKAVHLAPDNHDYKIRLCTILKNVSFGKFHFKLKKLILGLLQTEGLDYQDLSRAWFSVLLCDPDMQALRYLIEGKDYHYKRLLKCLSDPFLLEGMKRLIVHDMRFETALVHIKGDILDGVYKLQAFEDALAQYEALSEYVFCETAYPVVEEIDESIESISKVENEVSEEVRAQYEEHPYPRWTSIHVHAAPKSTANKSHDHLVAGCGTGYGLCATALRYPTAEITAIDLSRASLTYAKKKAKELELTNITFLHADILDLGGLDQTFDVIECSGVLHHMDDPVKGWACLLLKLKDGGKMHIGLYSEAGRQDVVAARALIAEKGYEPTHEGIRRARADIYALPASNPARGVAGRRDFYSTSSCRDLLFHVKENRFTIPKLIDAMDELGLQFDGFDLHNFQTVQSYVRMFPNDKGLKDLKNWATFEEKHPDTFRGMYQFWCLKA